MTLAARVLSLAGLLALAACAVEHRRSPWSRRPPLEEGREVYLQACASCHGVDAKGSGTVAAALTVAPPDLTTLARAHGGEFPREEVIAVISGEWPINVHGTREMPVWSQRFGGQSGATAAASLYARRRLELLADYLGSVQRSR